MGIWEGPEIVIVTSSDFYRVGGPPNIPLNPKLKTQPGGKCQRHVFPGQGSGPASSLSGVDAWSPVMLLESWVFLLPASILHP